MGFQGATAGHGPGHPVLESLPDSELSRIASFSLTPIIPSSVPPVMSAQAKITRLLRSTAPIKDNKLNGIYHLELMEQKFKLSINILKGI